MLGGEVALVTGSTSPVGAEIARRFAAEGASVVVTGRDRERGEAVVAAIDGVATFVAADLSEPGIAPALVDAATDRYGPPTVLVNAAAARPRGATIEETDAELWRLTLEIDLLAPARMIAACLPGMRSAGGGAIVNISSRAASHGTPRCAAYSAAKGGLEALTRQVSVDYAQYGIRCNAVRPGWIADGGIQERTTAEVTGVEAARQLTRPVEVRDVAAVCVWLASPEAETITGLVLPVDGGSTIARPETLG